VVLLREKAPGAKVVWGMTTPVRVAGDLPRLDADQNTRAFARNQIAAEIMKTNGIPVTDLYSAWPTADLSPTTASTTTPRAANSSRGWSPTPSGSACRRNSRADFNAKAQRPKDAKKSGVEWRPRMANGVEFAGFLILAFLGVLPLVPVVFFAQRAVKKDRSARRPLAPFRFLRWRCMPSCA
jgi:hypothetical protein